jgi:hypothetical protein
VEYNTSTNPTFGGAVRDTSGRGNDGVLGSGVYYDASEKSLVLDNSTGGFIHRDFGSQISGNFIHSISLWVKGDTFATGNIDVILWIGDNVDNKRIEIYASTTSISYNFKNNQYNSSNSVGLADGVWNHIAFTYNGQTGSAGREIYVNGKVIAASHSGNADELNITNGNLYIGSGATPGNGYDLDGSVSNFKLYDTTLTADEVKTLYDMGRNGSVANPQPLHIAAPLYAPGMIVQIEQSIKRDDSSTSSTSASDIPGLGVTIHPKFGTSKILVSYQVNMGGNYHMFLRVRRTQNGTTTYVGNGNANGNRPLATSYQSHFSNTNGQQTVESLNMEILDPANGMDPITYHVQFWVAHTNYTAWINRSLDNYNNEYGPGCLSSSITVKEVCQ